ncbi:hypothetical protein C1634_006745 [Chryseobacterium viscerum]|uniref:DUF6705 domain-containing protein n=2 Tax=Chryseobacterium viscerum TaxID=1037377 RepID=A0A316WM19_9FLAO|nr:hypothetical protein C1634_006745 [Chryseobacterium viscerum]
MLTLSCKAQQIYSLRPTETNLPENSYQRDTNNELPAYEGTWKGTWDNKMLFITFKKITNEYDTDFKYYRDYLIGKFKVLDSNGNVLFDNTNTNDDNAKILGVNFRRYGDKYSLIYLDSDLCNTTGNISISFVDSSKTKLNWKYFYHNEIVTVDCPYYNSEIPQPLPKDIVLTKQ